MYRLLTILVLMISMTINIESQNLKRYQYKNGHFVSKISGMASGSEEVWFDDYGMKELKIVHQTIEMMGIKQGTNTKTYMIGKKIYTINLDNNSGTQMDNPVYNMFSDGTNLEKIGETTMQNMGGKKIGIGKVLDKDCDIWDVKNLMSKVWIWDSLPMKTEVNMMGMEMATEVTKVEVNINLPTDTFTLPENVTFTEMGDFSNFKLPKK